MKTIIAFALIAAILVAASAMPAAEPEAGGHGYGKRSAEADPLFIGGSIGIGIGGYGYGGYGHGGYGYGGYGYGGYGYGGYGGYGGYDGGYSDYYDYY